MHNNKLTGKKFRPVKIARCWLSQHTSLSFQSERWLRSLENALQLPARDQLCWIKVLRKKRKVLGVRLPLLVWALLIMACGVVRSPMSPLIYACFRINYLGVMGFCCARLHLG